MTGQLQGDGEDGLEYGCCSSCVQGCTGGLKAVD